MNRQRNTSSLNSSASPENVRLVAGDETYDIDGGNFSFSFWIKFRDNDSSVTQTVFGNLDVNAYYSFITVAPETVQIETLTNGEYIRGIFSALTDDNWYHFTVTTAGDGTGIWYKDGVTTGVSLSYDTGSAIENNITLGSIGGSEYGANNSVYDCISAIDGVLIYNDTLTAAEVLRNYNATKGSHRN